MFEVTLILDRKARHLWTVVDGDRIAVIWNIDGVVEVGCCGYYRVMRNGRQVGSVWDVDEVKEEW